MAPSHPGQDVGCNGIGIASDDTRTVGFHDTGAIDDLVKPATNAMKPAGEWNHRVVTCDKGLIAIELNGEKVSQRNLDDWPEPSQRQGGSTHKYDVQSFQVRVRTDAFLLRRSCVS